MAFLDNLTPLTDPDFNDTLGGVPLDLQIAEIHDALEALRAKLGTVTSAASVGAQLMATGASETQWNRAGFYFLEQFGSAAVADHTTLLSNAATAVSGYQQQSDGEVGNDESVQGGTLVLPTGYVWLSSRIDWPSHVRMVGATAVHQRSNDVGNYGSRIKVLPGAECGAIRILRDSVGYGFERISFDGNKSTMAGGPYNCLEIEPTKFSVTGISADYGTDHNLIGVPAHQLRAGQRMKFTGLSGGSGIDQALADGTGGTNYYLLADGLDDDHVKLSLTAGGPAVDIGSSIASGTALIWTANVRTPRGQFDTLTVRNFSGWGLKASPIHLANEIIRGQYLVCDLGGWDIGATDWHIWGANSSNHTVAARTAIGLRVSLGIIYPTIPIVYSNDRNIVVEQDPDLVAQGYANIPNVVKGVGGYTVSAKKDGVYVGTGVKKTSWLGWSSRTNSTDGAGQGSHFHFNTSDSSHIVDGFFDGSNPTYDIYTEGSAKITIGAVQHERSDVANRYSDKTKIRSKVAGINQYSASAFPATPSAGDLCIREDRNYIPYAYTSPNWRSEQVFATRSSFAQLTSSASQWMQAEFSETYDHYLLNAECQFFPVSGTLDGTDNFWTVNIYKHGTGVPTGQLLTSFTINSGTIGANNRATPIALNALMGSDKGWFQFQVLKSVSATTLGPLDVAVAVTYQLAN